MFARTTDQKVVGSTPTGCATSEAGGRPLPADTDIVLPEAESDMSPAQLQARVDVQLLRALALLNKPNI
jgi:hypothetical protein